MGFGLTSRNYTNDNPMRLSEEKIKESLVDPEQLARSEALRYFTDSYSRDPEVMPLVIQALEQFGKEDAFPLQILDISQLKQTESTIDWAIKELNAVKGPVEGFDRYCHSLSEVLCEADADLLKPREEDIINAKGFSQESIPNLKDWPEVASWDADRCWQELELLSEKAASDPDLEELDFSHVDRVVKHLALVGEKFTDRILDLFGREIEDYEDNPLGWMELFLASLVGEMRLESAMPLLVEKLNEEQDDLWEELTTTLIKIGTPECAQRLAHDWHNQGRDFRMFASGALEKIHTDATVQVCLELLPSEQDREIKTFLANSLLTNFAFEGIEPVREIVATKNYDSQLMDLQANLIGAALVMGVTFPKWEQWKRESERRRAKTLKSMKEMEKSFRSPGPDIPPAPDVTKYPQETKEYTKKKVPERAPLPPESSPPIVRSEKKVGRNDPCPCGSGKKFKKCCMNKE